MSRVLPILFNTDMVKAILDGRKTVTRRIVKFTYGRNPNWTGYEKDGLILYNGRNEPCNKKPPYQVGDILYVRETWFYEEHMHDKTAGKPDLPNGRYLQRYVYKADNPEYPVNAGVGGTGWNPSIHMPKDAARIWLKVTNVQVEKLQHIPKDIWTKEGIYNNRECFGWTWKANPKKEECYPSPGAAFKALWNSTVHKKKLNLYGWRANPWVWVIEFERCEKPDGYEYEYESKQGSSC